MSSVDEFAASLRAECHRLLQVHAAEVAAHPNRAWGLVCGDCRRNLTSEEKRIIARLRKGGLHHSTAMKKVFERRRIMAVNRPEADAHIRLWSSIVGIMAARAKYEAEFWAKVDSEVLLLAGALNRSIVFNRSRGACENNLVKHGR
jgi:hypothetical protein